MIKGRVIIDLEADEAGECSWNMQHEGKDTLDDENLISLFGTILYVFQDS